MYLDKNRSAIVLLFNFLIGRWQHRLINGMLTINKVEGTCCAGNLIANIRMARIYEQSFSGLEHRAIRLDENGRFSYTISRTLYRMNA